MKRIAYWLAGCWLLAAWQAGCEPAAPAQGKPAPGLRQVRVFVGLCDNATQGIAPVGKKIGNGDDPDANLYWGCTDGLGSYFPNSKQWQVIRSETDVSPAILRRLTLRHVDGDLELVAEAYRGSQLSDCLAGFEQAAAYGKYALVAYIGHNGLMDFQLNPPAKTTDKSSDAIVLCCRSEDYFGQRLRNLGCKPVLTTSQLMYPGSFILHAAIESWRDGGTTTAMRQAAAKAYARNQKISVKSAAGVFVAGK